MKNWVKLLAVLAVVSLAVADEAEDDCSNRPEVTKKNRYQFESAALKLEPCLTLSVPEESSAELRNAKTLDKYRKFFKDNCPRLPQLITCIEGVRSKVATCQNKREVLAVEILSDLVEHIMTAGCENDGERLAVAVHGIRDNVEDMTTFKTCIFKISSLILLSNVDEVDLTSEYYLAYKTYPEYKKCFKNIQDEALKSTLEWFIDEATQTLKCQDPEKDRLVPCSTIDVSKVAVSSVCKLPTLDKPDLYDNLENKAVECFSFAVNRDLDEGANLGDLDWLKIDVQRMCQIHREFFECPKAVAGYAEACLPQEEQMPFHLLLEGIEDILQRGCLEDGAGFATMMHEVYRLTPEHGHAMRDCYKAIVEEGKKAQQEHALPKNMMFYHAILSYKQCLVEKLHANNDISSEAEALINDVLKKMKCVSPDDGTTVLCETVHVHVH